MEPSKQIKAVAQTYLQEQQLREQAEYIAVLENTIITIAEQIGVEPQQLINELNVAGAFRTGGIGGAVKAIGHNVKQALSGGDMTDTIISGLKVLGGQSMGAARAEGVAGRLYKKQQAGFARKGAAVRAQTKESGTGMPEVDRPMTRDVRAAMSGSSTGASGEPHGIKVNPTHQAEFDAGQRTLDRVNRARRRVSGIEYRDYHKNK